MSSNVPFTGIQTRRRNIFAHVKRIITPRKNPAIQINILFKARLILSRNSIYTFHSMRAVG